MSFCTKCGKQLADGEVCSCQAQQGMPQPVTPVTPVTPVAPQPQQTYSQPQQSVKAAGSTPDFIGDIMGFFKGVIKTPADAVRTFVSKGSLITSLIILAVCAVVTMLSDILYKIIANVRYEQAVQDVNLWDPSTWVVSEPMYSSSKIVLGAFGDLFFTFASAAIIAGVMYALIKYVFEKDSDVKFGQLLAIMALVELIQLPFSLVSTIFSYFGVAFISRVGGWISSFGGAFSTVALFVGLKANIKNDNNMFLVYAVAAFANAVVYGLLDIIGIF